LPVNRRIYFSNELKLKQNISLKITKALSILKLNKEETIFAAKLDIPNCVYDPVGLINLDDSGANRVKIVNNVKTLLDWLNEQLHIKTHGIL
jgi:hypothetical protein